MPSARMVGVASHETILFAVRRLSVYLRRCDRMKAEVSATQSDRVPLKVAAEIIGKSPSWMYRARRRRSYGPPWIKIGQRIMYSKAEISAWLDRCRGE